ncbi:MAG TPA: efflux RND transporter periplasmic adaptor subunit [Cellvibrionaceae bacterium]
MLKLKLIKNLIQRLGSLKYPLLAVLIVLVASLTWFNSPRAPAAPKPLYWVSSMDPNYRSDKPGKCPHGMDLIPVYAESNSAQNTAGLIKINSAVQNQLGVRKVKVALGILNQRLRTWGRVVADPTLVMQINPRTAGWVDMLFVASEGESVKRGQPLFSFYSPQLIEAQEQFLAASKLSEAQKLRAQSHLKALMMDDIAIETLKTQGVAQQSVIFHAPKDGVVDMLKARENAYIVPGQMVMAVGSMEQVWVLLDVFASQGNLILPRQAISLISASLPGKVWDGEVDVIAPELDAKSRNLRVRTSLANPNMQLRPNMLMEGLINLPARKPALLVSRQAVIQLENQTKLVMDVGDGTFKSVNVVLGESNNDLIEVLDGVEEGDIIVTSAQFLIDAESSKSSDFKRMQSPATASQYPPTWVAATITEVFPNEHKVQLEHEAIKAWQMPGMTMNFKLAQGLDLQNFKLGDKVRVKIVDGSPLFEIIELQPADATQ